MEPGTGAAPPELEAREPGAAAPVLLDAIRSEQVAALFRSVTVGVLGALAGAIVLSAVLVHTGGVSPWLAVLWVGTGSGCAVSHGLLRYLYGRAPAAAQNWRPWAFWFTTISFAEGVWLGCATLFLAGRDNFEGQILVVVACI